MTSTSIDTQLQHYWQLLAFEDKKSILSYIKSKVKSKEIPKRLTIEEYNRELDAAEARIRAGQFISQEDLEKEAASWI